MSSPPRQAASAAPGEEASSGGLEVTPAGAAAGAVLLTRSILGVDPWHAGTRSASGSTDSTTGSSCPTSPAAPKTRSRRASRSVSRANQSTDGGEVQEPPARNWEELNDLIKELHRNQLWFMYVFTSAREQFEAGPQQQADAMQNTLDDLSVAVDTTHATKRRMFDLQRRVDLIKHKVEGWRRQQIMREGHVPLAAAAALPNRPEMIINANGEASNL